MKVNVRDQQGNPHEIEGTVGWTLLEAIRGAGLSVKAECGGTCSCATCHVYIDAEWQDKLPAAGDMEIEMLDLAFDVQDNSRLSCQVVLEAELEGLSAALAPGTEE